VFPGDQPNTQQLLQQVQQMQQKLLALSDAQVEGSAGGGLVKATVTGAGELVALTIDPKAVDPADTETLADLVLAAVRDANRGVEELRAKAMGQFAQGLGDLTGPGGLPGLGGLTGPGGLPGLGGLTGPGGPEGRGGAPGLPDR
jgi:DNA-binding YbaB/EbfC family protein